MDTTSAILIAGPVIGLGLGIILGRIASRPDYWRRKFITAQAKLKAYEKEAAYPTPLRKHNEERKAKAAQKRRARMAAVDQRHGVVS